MTETQRTDVSLRSRVVVKAAIVDAVSPVPAGMLTYDVADRHMKSVLADGTTVAYQASWT